MHAWTRLGRATVFGAPIFVHWSVFLIAGTGGLLAIASPIHAVLFIGCYLAIIFAHEFGHALVANRLGYRVDSIVVTFWHGWCRYEQPDTEWEDVLIAWGGVTAQGVIAVPALLVALILGDRDWGYLTAVVVLLGYLNPVWAMANLLPGDHTDGRLAWRIVPLVIEKRRAKRATREARSRSSRR
jgi:Zn-dependent protease